MVLCKPLYIGEIVPVLRWLRSDLRAMGDGQISIRQVLNEHVHTVLGLCKTRFGRNVTLLPKNAQIM
jgi:hypothetical protein